MERLAAVARGQHGLVSLKQIRQVLQTKEQERWIRRSGDLVRVHQGVYSFPGVPGSWERDAFAALMVCGRGSALSHRSAGFVLGLDGVRPVGIEVAVPATRHVTNGEIQVHRTRENLPTFLVGKLRVTQLARTMVDLASVLKPQELEFALDCAQRKNRRLLPWIDAYVADLKQPCRPGLGVLMGFVNTRRDGAMDSVLEVRAWRVLRKHGFPPFVKRYVVRDRGVYVMRLDFAWPELKVALHVDSYQYHQQRERMARDAHQRSLLQVLGWRSVTVMHSMLEGDEWIDQLRRLLTERQRELAQKK